MANSSSIYSKPFMVFFYVALALVMTSSANADYSINAPDGRMIHLKEGTFQPD